MMRKCIVSEGRGEFVHLNRRKDERILGKGGRKDISEGEEEWKVK